MKPLSISLFGQFCATSDGEHVIGLESRKVQELVSYLALYRDRPHTREALAGLLWNEADLVQSKRYLSKTLWQLQTALKTQVQVPYDHLLSVDLQSIQFNSGANLWLDVVIFEQGHDGCRIIQNHQLLAKQLEQIEEALNVYQGDLLEGWYQPWCLYERERFRLMLMFMLDRLMDHHEVKGEFEDALLYGMRMLQYDPARERTHRRLMRLHFLAGNRSAALRQYKQCAVALENELGVKPSNRTTRLYRQIYEDKPTELQKQLSVIQASSPLLDERAVCIHLRRIHFILHDTQLKVAKEIEAIETMLKT